MKLSDKVIMLNSTKGSYCFLVFDKELILIDTGLSYMGRGIVKEFEQLHINPHDIKHILLTHHDVDHTGNLKRLKALTGAKVWAHKEDIPFITGEKDRPGFKKYLGWLGAKNRIQDIHAFRENMQMGNIQILFTPGHSPGHVCMLFEKMLFVGDLVENRRGTIIPYPNFWNWNTTLMLESIKNLKGIEFDWICTAHGHPIQQNKLPTW
jgi:glyoxylase-like metal-dependent hydrolase (beta-lactamase superfamily II)